jgi:hypothetical protein
VFTPNALLDRRCQDPGTAQSPRPYPTEAECLAEHCTNRGTHDIADPGGRDRQRTNLRVETTSDFSGSAEPTTVSLLPCAAAGGCAPDSTPSAYISIAGDDVIEPCVTAASIRVVAPGSSTPVVVNLRVYGNEDGQIF